MFRNKPLIIICQLYYESMVVKLKTARIVIWDVLKIFSTGGSTLLVHSYILSCSCRALLSFGLEDTVRRRDFQAK